MSLSSLNSIGQTVFELESANKNVDGQTDRQTDKKTGQTNTRNYTTFERNLAMMVIYVPVKFEFDWTNCFRVRVRKQKCGWTDGQTNRQKNRTNKHTELHQFRQELTMMVIYVPVEFEFEWTNCFRVRGRKQKCGRTDKLTKKRTNEQTELHQFRKEPSYDGDLCPCQV